MNTKEITLVRLLVRHAIVGFIIAVCVVKAILFVDFGGLGTLITQSDHSILATSMLVFFLGTTIASAQMGIAIMSLSGQDR